MSPPTPLSRERGARAGEPARIAGESVAAEVPHAVRRRRVHASRVRRRRLFAVDVGLGLALALLGFVLAPGLAIVALAAGLVLLACAVSLGYERARRRFAARRARRGQPGATPGAPRRG